MSCSVEIRVEDIVDTIYVPVQSVFRHLGKNVCFVDKGNGAYDVIDVVTGRHNDSHVEVTQGLRENQIVLLAPPSTFQVQPGVADDIPMAGADSTGAPAGMSGMGETQGGAAAGDGERRSDRGAAGADGSGASGEGRTRRGSRGEGGRPSDGSGKAPGSTPTAGGAAAEAGGESSKESAPKLEGKDSGTVGNHR
jgi:hypothetical protein